MTNEIIKDQFRNSSAKFYYLLFLIFFSMSIFSVGASVDNLQSSGGSGGMYDSPSDDFVQTVELKSGWNVFSPKQVVASHQFSAPETVNNFIVQVLDPTSVSMWNTMAGIGQTEFSPLYGYFINNKTAATQTLTLIYKRNLSPAQRMFSRDLVSGWNSIGFADPSIDNQLTISGETERQNEDYLDFINSNGSFGYFFDFTDGNIDRQSLSVETNWKRVSKNQIANLQSFVGVKGYGINIGNNQTTKHEGFQNGGVFEINPVVTAEIPADNDQHEIGFFEASVFGDRVEVDSLNICSNVNLDNVTIVVTEMNGRSIIKDNLTLEPCVIVSYDNQPLIFQPYEENFRTKFFDIFADVPTHLDGQAIGLTISGIDNARGAAISNEFAFPAEPVNLVGLTEGYIPGNNSFIDINGHWAQRFIESLVESGIIDTTSNYFYPDAVVTRAEFVKVALEATDGIIPELVPTIPDFLDVPIDSWYYDYIEVAYNLDVIQSQDGYFYPYNDTLKGWAMSTIVNSFSIPTLLIPPTDFTDVPEDDIYYDHITTAFNQCIVAGNGDGSFGISDSLTRGEMAYYIYQAQHYQEYCHQNEGDAMLEVSLSNDNPPGQIIPINGSNISFLALDLTAGSDADVEVSGLTVSLQGLGSYLNFEAVKVFDGYEEVGYGAVFSEDSRNAFMDFSSEPIFVEAGTTKTIFVTADMDGNNAISGSANYFSIDNIDHIVAVDTGVQIAGDFPINGNIMTVGVINVGFLDFTELATVDHDIVIGEVNVPITGFKITVNNVEDVLIKAITFTQKGNALIDDMANLSLWYGDNQIGETIPALNAQQRLIFDLTGMSDGGFIIEKGAQRTLTIKADIISGIDKVMEFEIDIPGNDVIAEGQTYGFNVNMGDWCNNIGCGGSDDGFIIVNGGSLNFSFLSNAGDVSPGSNDIEFGLLYIVNNGEPVQIQQFNLIAHAEDQLGSILADTCILDDIKFVSEDTSLIIFGPVDAPSSSTGIGELSQSNVAFVGDFVIDTNETMVLELLVDVSGSNCGQGGPDEGDNYHFELDMNTINYHGLISDDDFMCGSDFADCKPASNPETSRFTIDIL